MTPEIRYGVFVDVADKDRYVALTLADGEVALPYSVRGCLNIYKSKAAAEKYANKLTAARRFATHGYSKGEIS